MTSPKAASAKAARTAPVKAPGKLPDSNATIWTLTIQRPSWQATLEIDRGATLRQLHLAIQRAVKFDNDHLYEFYAARKSNGRRGAVYSGDRIDTPLAAIFPLPRNRKLFYLFDYGDSWRFQITRTRAAPQVPAAGTQYPRVIATSGEPPEQYPRYDY
jgi:hypothetical protein